MPAVKGLSSDVRKAMLSEEMGDGDGEVDMTTSTPSTMPEPAPVPSNMHVSPVAAVPPDPVVTQTAAVAAAIAQAIKEALGQASALARDPIPENKVSDGKSVYAHPDGDQVHPRTELRCPMYLGIFNEDGKALPAFEIFEDTCTEVERVELNKLQPGVYPGIRRNDGVSATWRVVLQTDDNDVPLKLIIAVPPRWLSQDEFKQMPGQLDFLAQLNAKQAAVKAQAA